MRYFIAVLFGVVLSLQGGFAKEKLSEVEKEFEKKKKFRSKTKSQHQEERKHSDTTSSDIGSCIDCGAFIVGAVSGFIKGLENSADRLYVSKEGHDKGILP